MSSRLDESSDLDAGVTVSSRADALLARARQGLDVLDAKLTSLPIGDLQPQERVLLMSLLVSIEEVVRRLERVVGETPVTGSDTPEHRELARSVRDTRYRLDQMTAYLTIRGVLVETGHPAGAPRLPKWLAARPGRGAVATAERPARLPGAATALGIDTAAEAETSGRRTLMRVGRVLTALGVVLVLFLLFEFWATDISEIRSQRRLLTEFTHELATGTALSPDALPVEGQPVALLRIPSIGLAKVVVEGTSPEMLKEGPGHFRNTPLPGQAGNSVIAGRRTTYGAPFQDLNRLVVGDQIEVTTAEGTFHYTVAATGIVRPGQLDVLSSSTDSRLTLLTSDPAFLAEGRLGVIAELNGDPLAAPVLVHPVSLEANETGLAGDIGGLPAVIVFGELLAVALVVVWALYRRWNRHVTYLLAMPVVLALLFMLFQNLDRLLPGTL